MRENECPRNCTSHEHSHDVKFVERPDIQAIFAPRLMKTSTLSTMTMVFVLKIKDGISAPTTKEVIITIIICNVRVIKVIVILFSKILSIVKVE